MGLVALVFLLSEFVFPSSGRSQECYLNDLQTREQYTIRITEDYADDIIALTSMHDGKIRDSITIHDIRDLDNFTVLDSSFLVLIIGVRVGSGQAMRHTKIYSLNRGMLFQNVSFVTLHHETGDPWAFYAGRDTLEHNLTYSNSFYDVELLLSHDERKNYRLRVIETRKESEHAGKSERTTFQRPDTTQLSFDQNRMVFTNQELLLDQDYNIYRRDGEITKVHIKDVVPAITVSRGSYLFYKKQWYQVGRDSSLFEE